MSFQGIKNLWTAIDTPNEPYAQGGNSYIFRVKGNQDSLCAVKLFKHDLEGERFNRFLDEIAIVETLNGLQGCVPCLDHGDLAGRPFYIMPFYEKGTFRSRYLTGAQIPIENKLSDFLVVLRIVERIHDRGLAIRDIKPQNILIDDAGLPVISDFGLSIWVDQSDDERHTPAERSVGSRGYRPPEWQSRYPDPNHKPGDIWSLGRTFWAMISGRNPPDNYETLGGAETHLSLYIDKSFANIVQSIVTACTHQDHTQRPSIAELISLSEDTIPLIEEKARRGGEEKTVGLSEVIRRFHTQLLNSSVYIDSQRMESARNVQLQEVEDAEQSLMEVLKRHAAILNESLPHDLGEISVSNIFKGTSFLERNGLRVDVCDNDHWGRIVSLRFDPSESIQRHKNIAYSEISFYLGIGCTDKFYWIVQLHDQSPATRGSKIVEQIAPKALGTVVSQKVSQMEEFLRMHFLPQIERHFTS
ncbi:protein kinase domain-containing protein [Pantoea sp.]|uniref:serine/threonine protein kinase n=1 Tax=Pantoea sp. TaxID=69393 RepID=UPI0028AC4509|nr:protein kinase [Pantoea sp.]